MRLLAHFIVLVALLGAGCKPPAGGERSPEELQKTLSEAYRVQGEAGIQTLKGGIGNFQQAEGRNPASLDELVERKVIPEIPAAPPGSSYAYDAVTGQVSLHTQGSQGASPPGPVNAAQALEAAVTVGAKADLKKIRVAINVYLMEEGRYPTTLEDLVQRKLLDSIPTPPGELKYQYDAQSGEVALVPK